MKPGLLQIITCVLLAVACLGVGGPAFADKNDEAAGRVTAAYLIADTCKGIGTVNKGASISGVDNGFQEASLDILVAQGFRRNPVAKRIYYASNESLSNVARQVLKDRGVDLGDKAALCRFGKSVAGTNDAIGQFLVKGD